MMYAKISIKGKHSIYLVNPVVKNGFICGKQIDKSGDLVSDKGADILHIIQLGEGVKVVPMEMNKHYCELERSK